MTTQTTTSPLMPATERPVPFQVRADLIVQRIAYEGTSNWVIKDPASLKYHRLTDSQYFLLNLLDGAATVRQLQEQLQRAYPQVHWTARAVQTMIADFHSKRLVLSDRLGQTRTFINDRVKQRWQKVRSVLFSFLFLRFPGWEPSRILDVLYPLVRWAFRPSVVVPLVLFVIGSWLWSAAHFDAFRKELPEFSQFFNWPNLFYLWLTLAVTKIFHEFGHALTCRHYGGECHEIGIMLLVFSPTLYCDVSDAWMMPNKWHRIWIGGAGMFVELVISALALIVWWNTQPGLMHQLALNVFFITSISTVVFNANPLIKFDGYYMLADFLEIPNLRAKAGKTLREWFGWVCLGIEPKPDPFDPTQGRGWFVLYAIAAPLYRCLLIVTIGLFLYTALKPYRLESIGATLAIASVASLLGMTVWNVIRMIRTPRETPLSRVRIRATLFAMAAVIAGIGFIPVPIYIEAPFTVQPVDVGHVYNSLPGTLSDVLVNPGTRVEAGETLAILINEEKEDRLREMETELDVQRARVETFHALGSSAEKALAEQRIDSLQQQIAELRSELAQLTIKAPLAGTVIAPASRPEPDLEAVRGRLPRWWGMPLDPENLGAFLEERTHLCSIAPSERMEAVLLIDQLDRNELDVGSTIRLKLDHLPYDVFATPIRDISHRQQEYAPPQLSNKSGGTLPTVTDEEGLERLTSVAYEATVDLDVPTDQVQTGYRGRARLLLTHKPLAFWLYRWLRRALYFRL
jgi:putative peptide zinc metalloprotease protein